MREAARELHAAVVALRELIDREYPSRGEVESRFVTKEKGLRRWYLLLVLIIVSGLLGFAGSVSAVSTCFLGDEEHTGACNFIPGYSTTKERNEDIYDQFVELQEITKRNEKRIEKLEENSKP